MTIDTSTTLESTGKLNKDDIWSHRDEIIKLGFDLPEVCIIEALPATGKSRGSMEWAAESGKPVTLLAPRHALLDDEYEPWCEKFDLISKRLVSFYLDCSSFEKNDDGEYSPVDRAAEDLRDEYNQGYSGEEVHARNPHTACQEDGECPYIEGLSFDPEDYDVLLGTYRHAHVKDWIEDRYVVFDEFPGSAFLSTFKGDTEKVISAYLQDNDDLPFGSFRDLELNRHSSSKQASIADWKDNQHSSLSDTAHVRRSGNSSAHTLGPLATLALIDGEFMENLWLSADLGSGKKAALNPEDNNWSFLLPPNLDSAESVIGLDGTPNEELWSLALNMKVQLLPLLSRDGKREYVQEILGLRFIQTSEDWKAIQSGDGAAPPKDLALIEGISQRAGQSPALISSQEALRNYRLSGLETLTVTTEHYNNLKGMNKFAEERLGIILGCPHPGDAKIQKWCAFAGVSAEVKIEDGKELRGPKTDYGPYGNRVMRTFIHDEVLQAAMRFGREEVDGERGATVYLHTSAIPEWLPIEKRIPKIQSWTIEGDKEHGMKQTIAAIRTLDNWKINDWKGTALYDSVSIRNRTVRDRLDNLVDGKYIKFEGKRGQGGAKHYTNICLEDAGRFGHVEFPG